MPARLKCPDPKCHWELVVRSGMPKEVARQAYQDHRANTGHFPDEVPFDVLWSVITAKDIPQS